MPNFLQPHGLYVACQAPLSMGFPRQEYWSVKKKKKEYWSVLPFLSPGDFPNPGIEPAFPTLAGGFFTTEPPGKSHFDFQKNIIKYMCKLPGSHFLFFALVVSMYPVGDRLVELSRAGRSDNK